MSAQNIDVGTFDAAEREFLEGMMGARKPKDEEERLAWRKPEEVVRVEGRKVGG